MIYTTFMDGPAYGMWTKVNSAHEGHWDMLVDRKWHRYRLREADSGRTVEAYFERTLNGDSEESSDSVRDSLYAGEAGLSPVSPAKEESTWRSCPTASQESTGSTGDRILPSTGSLPPTT